MSSWHVRDEMGWIGNPSPSPSFDPTDLLRHYYNIIHGKPERLEVARVILEAERIAAADRPSTEINAGDRYAARAISHDCARILANMETGMVRPSLETEIQQVRLDAQNEQDRIDINPYKEADYGIRD